MHRRGSFTRVFFSFLLLSFFVYAFFQTALGDDLSGVGELVISPFQRVIFAAYVNGSGGPTEVEKLQNKIRELEERLALTKQQNKEIQALRDQFAVTSPRSSSLLPAQIVGLKAFLPGYSLPEQIIIDKGQSDGVKKDAVVIYKSSLVGKVSLVRSHLSVVDLSFKKGFSITATTAETGALGIVKGQGDGELLLDNVVLSDTLKKDDQVLTKGSTSSDGIGASPNLILGKVVSIEKKPSSLFQTAKLARPIDVTRLTTVFVQLP